MKHFILISLILLALGTSPPPAKGETNRKTDTGKVAQTESSESRKLSRVSGVVRERGTRLPLKNITFFIKEKKLPVQTDEKGQFGFDIEPGTYSVIIPVAGYRKLETGIEVRANELLKLTFRVDPLTINPYQVVVHGKKNKSAVSAQRISTKEVALIPGSNRDVLASVSNLPGANSVSAFGGYGSGLLIRGSLQEDSLLLVNEHTAPLLYHFGGFESVIEPELVESVEFYAGAFSPEYGETTGGVVKLNLRDPRVDRFGGYVNVSLLSSSFLLEGPLSKNDSLAVSGKRGFLDQYIRLAEQAEPDLREAISFTRYPTYYDGTIIYNHDISSGNAIKLFGYGGLDTMKILTSEDFISDRFSNSLAVDQDYLNLVGEWHYKKGRFKSLFSPRIVRDSGHFDFGSRAFFNYTAKGLSFVEKTEYRLNKIHRLKTGGRLDYGIFDLESSWFTGPKEGEIGYNPYATEINTDETYYVVTPSIYAMDEMTPGRFIITPGFFALYDTQNEHHYIDPRLAAKYKLTKTSTLKAATGLYSKTPQIDESYEPFGTQGLKPERSFHKVAGVEHHFTDDLFLDVQVYHKDFEDLVVRVDAQDSTQYANDGTGYAYGAEILLRHNMTERFFGWLSYSYSVSKRKDGNGQDERYFDYDIPHNLTAVASYKLNRNWTIGLRYKYASGTPYTDLLDVDTMYDTDNDHYTPLYDGPVNDERIESYQQLDLRVDKHWVFDNWILSAYADVRNVFQQEHVIEIGYNDDYSEVYEEISLDSAVPLIFIGLKASF